MSFLELLLGGWLAGFSLFAELPVTEEISVAASAFNWQDYTVAEAGLYYSASERVGLGAGVFAETDGEWTATYVSFSVDTNWQAGPVYISASINLLRLIHE